MIEEKWHKMKLAEQMGNIGAEFLRMVNLKKKNDKEGAKRSLERLLELIDLTIEDERLENRLFEIFRLREIVCDIYFDNRYYKVSVDNLKKYFINFSYLI